MRGGIYPEDNLAAVFVELKKKVAQSVSQSVSRGRRVRARLRVFCNDKGHGMHVELRNVEDAAAIAMCSLGHAVLSS